MTTTLPEQGLAERVGETLVRERLAACSQVAGPISSTYWWKGQIEHAGEWYCYLKTTLTRLPALRARLRELHPYEVPELITVPLTDGDPDYLKWIAETVG